MRCSILLALCSLARADVSYVRQTSSATAPTQRVTGRLDERNAGTGGICDAEVVQRSGYFQIDAPNKTNEHYFYWMFESRSAPTDAPFILWLTGGPGCSGMLALLNENGPCTIGPDLRPVNNTLSWTNGANVLWLDQPAGVGFSYGDSGDYDHDEVGVRDDVYHFLLAFFQAHPQYAKNDFFVFGESYGGHYAPNVAYRIHQGNVAKEGAPIALTGLAVGNGLTDPATQYPYYPKMAMNNTYGPIKTVSEASYAQMVAAVPGCVALIDACQTDVSKCAEAQGTCNNAMLGPYEEAGLNPYVVPPPCHAAAQPPSPHVCHPPACACAGTTSASRARCRASATISARQRNGWTSPRRAPRWA